MQISSFIADVHPDFGFSAAAFTPFFIILGVLVAWKSGRRRVFRI